MIGSLRGKVVYKTLDHVEIEAGGVGREVFLPAKLLTQLAVGQKAKLFVYHQVTEKAEALYGFLVRQDKRVFEMLLTVTGIGPKIALEIFSTGNAERILRAVAEADIDFFQQAKGLGRKGSQRIIVDLKSKVGQVKELDLCSLAGGRQPVYQALKNLGFTAAEIGQALQGLPASLKSENEIIKYALTRLSSHE